VIATNYSAHTEFLTEENAWLLPIYGVEPAYDRVPWMPSGKWFQGQGNWSCFMDDPLAGCGTMTNMVNHMRLIHDRKQSGQLELNYAGIKTAEKFTWENTAQRIVGLLS
jgi:hypothetical protein